MIELLRTNDTVYLSFASAVLKDAAIEAVVFDEGMSTVYGSLSILPRRLLVDEDKLDAARRILIEARLMDEAGMPMGLPSSTADDAP